LTHKTKFSSKIEHSILNVENSIDENVDSDDELLFDSNINQIIIKKEYEVYFDDVVAHKIVSNFIL
jgi:hypothetical protein